MSPEARDDARSRRVPRRAHWFGVAAMVVLAIVVMTPLLRDDREATGSAETAGDLEEQPFESLLDEGRPLPRGTFRLRWSGAPEGTIYSLEIATEDLTVLHRKAELEATEYTVPPSALEELEPGTVILWRVEALLPDTRRAASPVFKAVLE